MGRKRKQRKPAIEGDTSSLPCEVIYSILTKLPVKSLLRFKCVCKSWRGVISDPEFAKSHLNESIRLDHQRLLDSGFYHYDLYSIDNESCEGSGEEVSFPGKKYWNARVLCSCNGLVLLHVEGDKMYVLWNPSIRAQKKFSSPPSICNSYVPRGLCYDSSMDDYKVIFTSNQLFVVFSFKGQCWSEPRQFPYLCFCGDMVIANGVSHWVASTPTVANVRRYPSSEDYPSDSSSSSSDNIDDSGDDNGNYYLPLVRQLYLHNSDTHIPQSQYEHDSARTSLIVYFDTADDKFKEMPPPKCIKEGDIFRLTVMKGWLSLYCNTVDRKHIVVWTMKQYGEKNSWTKFVVIPRWLGYLCYLAPLCATKNGEIVMISDGHDIDGRRMLVTYNPKVKECRIIGKTRSYFTSMLLYVDSLVLPIRTPQVKGKRKKEL